MRVALITTPPSVRSGIGDYTRHLLPYLRELCDVELFVEHGHDEPGWGEERARDVAGLDPRDYDQVLYQLGNERAHAFMARMIRAVGGTVMQHDWVLFDLALAAWPGLARGGWKGHLLALREGGIHQARRYVANWRDRRRQRVTPLEPVDASALEGTLLAGWHFPEEGGRWTADRASLRIPAAGVRSVRIELHADEGRSVRLLVDGDEAASMGDGALAADLDGLDRPLLEIETCGIVVSRAQREHGDARRLGCMVRAITWTDGSGEHALSLQEPATRPILPVSLSRDRFELPLNRSVVRFADAFIVHSRYVADRIQDERNARTPIGLVHHGAEIRWRDEDRRLARERLGLDPAWRDGFLLVSFGGIQPHKRIDKALEAVARVHAERPDVRFVIAGKVQSESFDPRVHAARLGIADAVHCPGFVSEEEAWDWLHAGDIALNLRGPTSGGTSGGIFQAFGLGRSVIASDAGEQRELPDDCVLKIPLGDEEVPTLARTLLELRDAPARRAELEANVRRFVENECHWARCARRYHEFMERFPRPRVTRRSMVALRVALDRARAAAP